ncbi:MAG: ABC transporter permease [Chloroflexi bacterium]|nr:ABC transporter permease [Chloroflexota bacterium]MCL5075407.1 ABC transporter permease [Chloroflexota bacterium]
MRGVAWVQTVTKPGHPGVGWGMITLRLLCGAIVIFLILPIFIIIPISFSSSLYLEFPPKGFSLQWYQDYFGGPGWVQATLLSVEVASVVMILATILGTLSAFGFVRGRFPGKGLIYGFILSPLIVPSIITAIAVYFLYASLRLVGTALGMILAHTVLAIPLVVVIVSATLAGFDTSLERAAMSLGANPLQTFRRVTLPIISPGVFTAAIFAFLTSFDEVVIAIFIAGTRAVTLPKKMWEGVWLEINPTIAAVSSFLIVLTVLILVTTELLRSRMARLSG